MSSHVASAGSPPNVALDLGQRRDDHRLGERVGQAARRRGRAGCGSGAGSAVAAGAGAGRCGRAHRRSSIAAASRSRSRAAWARSPGLERLEELLVAPLDAVALARHPLDALVGERDPDDPPIARARAALDERVALEAGEHPGRGRGADARRARELADAQRRLGRDQRLEQVVLREASARRRSRGAPAPGSTRAGSRPARRRRRPPRCSGSWHGKTFR